MGIMPPPSGPIELDPSNSSGQALSAAERGNAGKQPGRPDGGIRHRAVSSTVPPTYIIMLGTPSEKSQTYKLCCTGRKLTVAPARSAVSPNAINAFFYRCRFPRNSLDDTKNFYRIMVVPADFGPEAFFDK